MEITNQLHSHTLSLIATWWRHQMETFSVLFQWSSVNTPHKRPMTRSFDVCFDLRMNKPLSKPSWGWWFETHSRSLWRHCNGSGATYSTCTCINVRIKRCFSSYVCVQQSLFICSHFVAYKHYPLYIDGREISRINLVVIIYSTAWFAFCRGLVPVTVINIQFPFNTLI